MSMSSKYPGASQVVHPLASARDTGGAGSIPGLGRSPGVGNGNSSILAWRIPRTEECSRLWNMGSQRVGHEWVTEHTYKYQYALLWIIFLFLKNIYLAALGLGCGTQDLWSLIRVAICRLFNGLWVLVPWSGIQPRAPALEVQMDNKGIPMNFISILQDAKTTMWKNSFINMWRICLLMEFLVLFRELHILY